MIPARDEAETIGLTVKSLLEQDYPGDLQVVLVDDQSGDGTADVARQQRMNIKQKKGLGAIAISPSLQVTIYPQAGPENCGLSSKALKYVLEDAPDYILLTDADIQPDPLNLRRLASLAVTEHLDMASVMVRLRCESTWEQFSDSGLHFLFP